MQLFLSNEPWKAKQYDAKLPDRSLPDVGGDWFPIKVPGAIQYDLMALGKLENPYASTENVVKSDWVAKSDWLCRTEFDTPAEIDEMGAVFLRFDGIDTFSEVWLNGKMIGETANAYRIYDLPVQPELFVKSGKNKLLVRIKAHERMIADKMGYAERLGIGSADRKAEGRLGKALIRRYQRSFATGSSSLLNLGAGVLGIGINREISILAYSGTYLADCCFRTLSVREGKASATVTLDLRKVTAETRVTMKLEDGSGKTVASADLVSPKEGEQEVSLTIDNPRLWQPAGYGEAYLYTLTIQAETGGKKTDEIIQKVGIRTVELVTRDTSGKKTFYLKINGQRIMVHGQNLIPLDYIKSYGSREEYERLFALWENQYVNLVRIWGGGVVEDPWFYRECDRRGIIIFHELFLHSNVYPDWDEAWVKEFMIESEGVLKQIRTHPCLCLVSGGNEQQEGWDEWGWKPAMDRFYGEKIARELLLSLSTKLCPELPYIYNSPHGGKWSQSPVEGECHNWNNYYNSTKDPTFVTETCWTTHSYSRPETLKKYMNLDVDDFKGLGWTRKWAQRTSLPWQRFMPYSSWFEVMSLREYLHSLEIEQMRADHHALSNFRFQSPANSGIVYWSFNKGGPLFQFGCVDYGGYPLMAYYAIKKIYAPYAVQAYRDIEDISVVFSSHAAELVDILVEAWHFDKKGTVLDSWSWDIKAEPGSIQRIARLDGLYGRVKERTEEAVYVRAVKNGIQMADDMFFFCPYSEFEGEYRPLKVKADATGQGKWRIILEAETPVRMVEMESNQKLLFTDNYFPMLNGKEKVLDASLLEKTSNEPIKLTIGILGAPSTQSITLD